MTVSARPRPASLPLPGGRPDAVVKVHPLVVADMHAPPHFWDGGNTLLALLKTVVIPRSRWTWLPIPAFLVEHPSAGPILVDTAFHASVASDPAHNLGRAAARMYDIRMQPEQAVPAQILARGVDPADVELVVMTHLHHDHASGIGQFPDATFVVEQREWTAASSGGIMQGYRPQHLDGARNWQTVDLATASPDDGFDHVVDLLGDGSFRLVGTPGHTAGHMSVLLRVADGDLLLTSDAAYARRSIDEHLIPMTITGSQEQYEQSLRQIAAWSGAHPEAPVICGHDPWNLADLERVY